MPLIEPPGRNLHIVPGNPDKSIERTLGRCGGIPGCLNDIKRRVWELLFNQQFDDSGHREFIVMKHPAGAGNGF